MKQIIIIIALMYLVGCSVAQRPISAEVLNKIDKVGVVSAVNQEFCYSYVGLTVFSNYLKCSVIKDYDLNDLITKAVIESASTQTNIPLDILNASTEFKDKVNNSTDYNGNLKPSEFIDFVRNDKELSGYRYLLIVRPDTWQFNEVSHPIKGVGIFGHRNKSGFPYLIYQLELIDSQTGEILAVGSTSFRNSEISLPWIEPYGAYSPEQKKLIWSFFERVSTDALARATAPLFYRSPKK